MHLRLTSAASALLVSLACGGAGGAADAPGAGGLGPPSAGSPAPSVPPVETRTPPPSGGTGSNRFQIGSQGLYLQDPAAGEPTVSGLVLVNLDRAAPPAGTTVTLNGVPLARWMVGTPPAPSDRYWTVDPAGPQPVARSGGWLEIVADTGTGISRSLVLPCPHDVAMTTSPAAGASLAGLASVPVEWSPLDTLTVAANAGVPAMAGIQPTATMRVYDPALGALEPGAAGAQVIVGPSAAGVIVPFTPRAGAPGYLVDVRWPGAWIPDGGETGAFCGLVHRIAFQPRATKRRRPEAVEGFGPSERHRADSNRRIRVLQTRALPLGDGAVLRGDRSTGGPRRRQRAATWTLFGATAPADHAPARVAKSRATPLP